MMEICPEELMMEIFSWLPVRSLFRFKCVSKSWNITLSDPYFKAKHQIHHSNSPRFLLLHNLFNSKGSFYNLYSLSSPDDDIQKLDDLPSNIDPYFHLLFGSFDGLVLIGVASRSIDQLLLCNPSTRESILLPVPEFGILNSTFGLGYDQTTNDYVILTLHDDMVQTHPYCGILALKSGSWRKVCIKTTTRPLFRPVMERYSFCMDSLSFIHGAFHWMRCSRFVVSLNISNETQREIPFPEQMYNYPNSGLIMKKCGVSVWEGMLCVSSTWRMMGGKDTFMLWAMKDYGVKESWTQLFKINFNAAKLIYRFVDDVLFHCHTLGLILSKSSRTRTSKGPAELWLNWFDALSGQHNNFEVITFTESLISPKSLM